MNQGTVVIGLTGSIGMGKTTAANMLRRLGLPVFDADATVHELQRPGGAALPEIAKVFPGLVKKGILDREGLAKRVFEEPGNLRQLEEIVHPLVHDAEQRFFMRVATGRTGIAVLEIPLLFESGAEHRCDFTIVVSAPSFVQKARVLWRPGMTITKFNAILAQQLSDAESRSRADFIVPTGMGRRYTLNALRGVVRLIRGRKDSQAE